MVSYLWTGGEEHPAILAYNAAVEMLQRLEGFNEYLQRVYNETFQIGVGMLRLCSGWQSWYPEWLFTAIGDTVNVAARIESATKGRANILVSEPVV